MLFLKNPNFRITIYEKYFDSDKAVGKLRKQGAILRINPRCVLRVNYSKHAILNLSFYWLPH